MDMFHTPQHLALQAPEGWQTFTLTSEANQHVCVVIHFHLAEQTASSPLRAPFGSFYFFQIPPTPVLQRFVGFIESNLKERNIRKIIIKSPPDLYTPQAFSRIKEVLLSSGYSIGLEEISSIIQVNERAFESGLNRAKKKKLNECSALGLDWSLLPIEYLDQVYQFLHSCRKLKDYTLSMSLPELKSLATVFHDKIVLSVLKDQDVWVAAGVTIRINKRVIYHFYFDHAAAYDHRSPVILLNKKLYEYCRSNEIELLDLGTSTVAGRLKPSLLRFKQEMGAIDASKVTFEKSLK